MTDQIMAPPFPMRMARWVKDKTLEMYGEDGAVHNPWKLGKWTPIACLRVVEETYDEMPPTLEVRAVTVRGLEYDTGASDAAPPQPQETEKDWIREMDRLPYIVEWWSEHDGEWLPV